MKIRKIQALLIALIMTFFFSGCEDTNLELAVEAGLDVIRAVTLSDEQVIHIAKQASEQSDSKHRIAPPGNPYDRRLKRLVGESAAFEDRQFNFKVYLSPDVNAFAMADGTIRVYSGLMDIMNDQELLFVIGHEMGHVTCNHIKKKIMVAYGASALRKAVASQENTAGNIARSDLGGLVQGLLNAQFSQAEEKEADDQGLLFLQQKNLNPDAAVTSLLKLARLGNNHSVFSSHPDPENRARRMKNNILLAQKGHKDPS